MPEKTRAGVASSNTAPAIAPTADTGAHRLAHDPVPRNSDRETMTEPGQQATPATRLATAAGQAGTPAKISAGYETSEVMPPAVPTRPAKAPATRRKISSVVEITSQAAYAMRLCARRVRVEGAGRRVMLSGLTSTQISLPLGTAARSGRGRPADGRAHRPLAGGPHAAREAAGGLLATRLVRGRKVPRGELALSLADAVAGQVGFTSILTLTLSETQCRSASTS